MNSPARNAAEVVANLWADRPLMIDLPGKAGRTNATVRRFVEYGGCGHKTSRWGVELTQLTIEQRALWGRFIYTVALETGRPLTALVVRVSAMSESPR